MLNYNRYLMTGLLLTVSSLGLSACNSSDGAGVEGQVIQQGANLDDIPPLNKLACRDGYPIQIPGQIPPPLTTNGNDASSCLLLTFFPGAQPTQPGTVVSANIRVGAVTGRMRFVRMRILLQNILVALPNHVDQTRACCSVEQYGPVFVPTANSVTTVDLNFPMVADHVPPLEDQTTIAAGDLVGLEVLDANVPIPGNWVNGGGEVLTLPNYLWLPSMSARGAAAPTQNLRSEGSYSGFMPSYNLNFRPSGAAKTSASPAALFGP